MPELPEVETTRRGITPHILGQNITKVVIRQRKLRWPIPRGLTQKLQGQTIQAVERRAKYLLLKTATGTLILHLGMSGSLRILPAKTPAEKHDHFDIIFGNGQCLRLTDPRRFGAVLWSKEPVEQHKLIQHLGPEPLSKAFSDNYLYAKSRVEYIRQMLSEIGLGEERLRMVNVSAAMARPLSEIIVDMVETVRAMGPNPIGQTVESENTEKLS